MAPRWQMRDHGLTVLGNEPTKLEDADLSFLSVGPPAPGGLDALLAGGQSRRPIHREEMQTVVEALSAPGDSADWIPLAKSDNSSCSRRAGESNLSALTFRVEARMPGIPIEVLALNCTCMPKRVTWDSTIIDHESHDEWGAPGGTECGLSYLAPYVPLVADRDFLTYSGLATAEDGSGYCTFLRDAQHPAYPEGYKNRVRGQIHGCALMVMRDEQDPGSSRFVMISKQDIKMTAVPSWLINRMVPQELRKGMSSLTSACHKDVQKLGAAGLLGSVLPELFPSPTADNDGQLQRATSADVVACAVADWPLVKEHQKAGLHPVASMASTSTLTSTAPDTDADSQQSDDESASESLPLPLVEATALVPAAYSEEDLKEAPPAAPVVEVQDSAIAPAARWWLCGCRSA